MIFDRLTQTLDREFFEYLLDLEVRKAARYLYFLSLLVIQPNEIKISYLPDEQEIFVKTLAYLIRDEVRGTDIIGRIGERKFFLMLHQADSQSTYGIAERVRSRVENYTFIIDGREEKRTVSIGGACFPTHVNDITGLIQKAEEMMVRAEAEGGNKVYMPGG